MARGVLGMTPKLGKRKKRGDESSPALSKICQKYNVPFVKHHLLIFPLLLSAPAAISGRKHSSNEQTK